MKPSTLTKTLEFMLPNRRPVMIVGPPGIGKTDIVKQACNNINSDLVISHPVVSDPTDYKGLPFPTDKGTAEFLPFGDLNKLIQAKKHTVFFLDDLGQSSNSVQSAAMQLILGRQINGHKVSDAVTFVAATNRKSDMAGVSGILEPVKSRFASILELEVDLDDWIKWAITNKMPPLLMGFMRFKPDLLHNFKPTKEIKNSPCPRTIAAVGNLINDMGETSYSDIEYELYSGAAGEGFATEFMGYSKIWRKLPSLDGILKDPSKFKPIDAGKEPALAYALCSGLANRVTDKTVDNAFKYINKISEEFQVVFVKDMITRDEELASTEAYINWATSKKDFVL